MKPLDTTISIREISSFHEMDACIDLQQSVWQFRDLDIVPRRMFVVARAVGGQILGAWDGSRLAGYALAIPGVREGRPYLHSHMLAVAPEYRNRSVGARLKFAQRDSALQRGIDRIEWTFDPLQAKNAFFNLEKLGAIVRRYTPDFYGPSASPLHGLLPTDRLHAEWWLRSERVEALVSGLGLPEYEINKTVSVANIQAIAKDVPGPSFKVALEVLLQIRIQFRDAFSKGLIGLRFQPSHDGDAQYLLGTVTDTETI